MSLSTCRISAVAAVSDMDRARQFYEGSLGLRQADDDTDDSDGQRLYACGEQTTLLVYLSPEHAGHSSATLGAWQTDDLESEMAALKIGGVQFEQYDQPGFHSDERGIVDMDGFRAAWFKDPDGNTFAVGDG